MEGGAAAIGKEALFEGLEVPVTRVTVVTPNQRLAQALQREFGDRQATRGLRVWETPDILPFTAFVERLWSEALHSERGASVPGLLSEAQELVLWDECIRPSHGGQLMSVELATAQAREAWRVVHAWSLRSRLAAAASHEDAKIFLGWAERYEKASAERKCTDEARLPDVVRPLMARGALKLPATLVAFGFETIAPQAQAFLDALAKAGTRVTRAQPAPRASRATRLAFSSAREEMAACARWARARLDAGSTSIGIVAPDLSRSRKAIARALADALVPGRALPQSSRVPLPFEVSLAPALDEYPVVSHALALLRLCGSDVEFETLSSLVRSPFLGGAEAERSERARLDVELRRRASAVMNLEALRRVLGKLDARTPTLEGWLVRLAKFRNAETLGARAPSAWAQAFTEALHIAGFPGERTLDTNEFQAVSKWHEVLAEFATLDRVVKPLGFPAAWDRLAGMVHATLFQPKGSHVPVQVLGILESAGMEFEHLWVLGLTDEAWPLAERANAFVSLRLQREAGVPQADPDASLELDRRITQGWLGAAEEVVMSHALAESDRELIMSPLIREIAPGRVEDLAISTEETLRDAIRKDVSIERLEDARAPAIAQAAQPHGTRLFQDQAACPFRGFAHHRLNAGELEGPSPGVDARERGTLIHAALSTVWQALGDKAHLDALTLAERDVLLARAADEAIAAVRKRRPDALGGRFGTIERARLMSHLAKWLALEARREDFTVVANEQKTRLTFGGVEVEARLDRMDRLANGGHAVIDYKTGEARVADWLGDRPDQPQLPMYAVGAEERVDAVAFGRVKAGDFSFEGLGVREDILPNVKTIEKNRSTLAKRHKYKDWADLVARWRVALDAIGQGYAQGDARVDPRDGFLTCKLCDQRTFCRVDDRPAGAEAAEESE